MKTSIRSMICLLLALTVCLAALAGCGAGPSGSGGNAGSLTDDEKQIGIVQSIEHTSLNQISDAIVARLQELGYKEEQIEYQNAQGDTATLSSICQKFQGDGKDLVIAVGTTTALAAAGSIRDIPVFFSSVTDPVGAGLVESYDQTDGNLTGIANFFPLEDIFKLAFTLTPDVRSIGFLHCTSEYGAGKIIEDAVALLDAQYPGVTHEEFTISAASELQMAVESMVGKVDAIFIPNDSVVASAMSTVAAITREKGIPVYVTADSLVWDGGLATVGINYAELGRMTAEEVDKILGGQPVADTPVQDIDSFRTVLNETTAEAIGVVLPDDLRATADVVADQ